MEKCNQQKCGYLGTESCPKCDECGAEPNLVDRDCTSCWNCEHDQDILRGKPELPEGVVEVLINPKDFVNNPEEVEVIYQKNRS